MTSGTTYVISTLSKYMPSPWFLMWSPLTEVIHSLFRLSVIGDYICCLHVVPVVPRTGDDIGDHIGDDLCGPLCLHVVSMSSTVVLRAR